MRRDLQVCREILARGSRSFAMASLLLPRRVEEPAAAVYAFCREADDAVDAGQGGVERVRERLERVFAGVPQGPVERELQRVVREHGLPRAPFDGLLEGFAWDQAGRRYADIDGVVAYSARVASTVGVIMTRLMGRTDAPTLARAAELGVAMQLTNIARDVGEDHRRGRTYLPEQWLAEEGLSPKDLGSFSPALGRVVRRLLAEADRYYESSRPGIAALPWDCRPAIVAASRIYRDIGREVARRGHDSVSGRAVVSWPRKVWLVLGAVAEAVGMGVGGELDPNTHAELRFLLG